MPNYLVIDTETGGVNAATDALLSVGLVAVDRDGNILGKAHIKVDPEGRTVNARALEINKISMEQHAQETLSRSDSAHVIKRFIYKHFGSPSAASAPIVMGHNVPFDLNMVYALFEQFEMNFGVAKCVLDTRFIACFLHDLGILELPNFKLDALMEHYGITMPEEDRHTALGDCLVTLQVYIAVRKDLESRLIPVTPTK